MDGKPAVDEFEIAERGQKRRAAASFLFPSLPRGKTQRGKEFRQPLKGRRTPGRAQKRDALDHESILAWGPSGVRLPNFHGLPPCPGGSVPYVTERGLIAIVVAGTTVLGPGADG